MRADRLLSILMLLQTHSRMTARELAARLQVSERTIHRDMEALSAAGVPVLAERGVGGGWSLLDDYRTNLTGLNPAEIQALFLTHPAQLLADLGMRQAAEGALAKLLAALPDVHRGDAELVRQRIHVDGAGWKQAEETVACLPTIQEAIWRERKLQLRYQRGDDSYVEREVDPLGLVAKSGSWYLVAAVDGDLRTYRASRVQDARILDEPCLRPDSFDLAAYWEHSTSEFKANLPRYPARLRVLSSIIPHLRALWRFAQIERVDPPDADGWSCMEVTFETDEEACIYVAGFGAQIEVIEPPELREQVIQQARAALALYAR